MDSIRYPWVFISEKKGYRVNEKKFLATIVAVGLVAVAAFAGANGLTETQAACEHSQVKDGACVDCNDPVECIEVEDASGTAKEPILNWKMQRRLPETVIY